MLEAVYGTSEFFSVKHRLLQYAIQELEVRVFVLEDNQLTVERINEYILSGKGKAEEMINGLFAVWNTEEILKMTEWVRSQCPLGTRIFIWAHDSHVSQGKAKIP